MPRKKAVDPTTLLKSPPKKPAKKQTKPVVQKEKEDPNKEYICTACGSKYKRQDTNFTFSYSPFYAGNNHRITVCNTCLNSFLEQYIKMLGNEDEAVKRICLHFDLYLDEVYLESSKNSSIGRNRIKSYIRMQNLSKNRGKTYDDYLAEQVNRSITSTDEFEEAKADPETRLTKAQLSRWGLGFAPDEYKMLDEHYKSLNEQRSSDDPMQDIYIRDLCEIKVLQTRALNSDRFDDWAKYKSLYQATAKTANLNPKQQRGAAPDKDESTYGEFISMIETTCPAEYYADQSKFFDFSNIGDYVKRFILRPMKNWFCNSREMDAEYSLDDSTDSKQ